MELLALILSFVTVVAGFRSNSVSDDVIVVGALRDCSEPRDVGRCSGQEEAWYYSSLQERCMFFVYSGCGGNSNRFRSRPECEAECEAQRCPELDCPDSCTRTRDTNGCEVCACTKNEAEAVCSSPHQRGYCRALHHKWAWSPKEARCVPFVYGGCGGTENNFDTEETCLNVCASL
ncbi:hypothetical protein Pcinc_016121 [Petrolisthes cinctipes]|uniref:BPTI/Kunitz inhibitor domain-containing protein n=1 Tax=Petrolisthes cinctipes TaxID=88211 RepID=A0AAE1KMA1_PETCI|nr:hypothetical protein Pcinc_016121 [Petrolisthes cinctipes]